MPNVLRVPWCRLYFTQVPSLDSGKALASGRVLRKLAPPLSAHLMGGPSTQVAVPWRESRHKGCRRNILLTTARENTERPHHRPGGRGKGVKTAQNLRNHRGRGTFSCLPPVTWQHMAPPPLKSFAAEEHTDLTPQECCREDVGTKNSPQPVKTAWKSSHKSVGRHLPGCLRRVTCRKWHHKTCNNITHNTTEHCRGRETAWSDNPQNKKSPFKQRSPSQRAAGSLGNLRRH